MSLLRRLFRPRPELPPELAQRVAQWRALPEAGSRTPLDQVRFVVVDVETTGLDPRHDRLLAIGAAVLEGLQLRLGEGFETLLRQTEASPHHNILIHGIGPTEQAAGVEPEEALSAFLQHAGKSVLVAYHADFDRAVLERAVRRHLGVALPNPWLDLAWLAPALCPKAKLRRASLDDWLNHFGLLAHTRHRALADAAVTAELFLILLHRARTQGVDSLGALQALAHAQERRSLGGGMGGP